LMRFQQDGCVVQRISTSTYNRIRHNWPEIRWLKY
jgi:hypothetical protein